MANYEDSDFLDLIIKSKNLSPDDLVKSFNIVFIKQEFPKNVAILKLMNLFDYLVYAEEFIGNQHKITPIYSEHLAIIKANIDLILKTLLALKHRRPEYCMFSVDLKRMTEANNILENL